MSLFNLRYSFLLLFLLICSCSPSISSQLIQANKLIQNNQKNEAILLYKELAETNPTPEVLLGYGSLLVEAGLIRDGEAVLLKVASADPTNSITFYNLGICQMTRGKRRKAVEYFTKAIELSPNWVEPIWNRGTAYDELADWDQALTDYNRALELDPENADIYNNRGNTFTHFGRIEEAIDDFKKALEINPNHQKAKSNLDTLVTM